MEVATSLGLKEADIRKSMAENPNDAQVQETYKLANSLGITGTPSYIVGNEAVFGAVGADPLKEKSPICAVAEKPPAPDSAKSRCIPVDAGPAGCLRLSGLFLEGCAVYRCR